MFGIDDYVLGTVGGAMIGGLFSSSGQSSANSANAALSQRQMDFQERMSGTAYQRATADMQKAGLNPMLAYSQGGASSPGGSTATMANPRAPVGEAIANSAQRAADIKRQEAETARVTADIPRVMADARSANASAAATEFSVAHLLPWDLRFKEQDWFGHEAEGKYQAQRSDALAKGGQGGLNVGRNVWDSILQRQVAESTLEQAKVPGALNKMASDQTGWGRYIRPYLDDAGKITSSASDILRTIPMFRLGSFLGDLKKQGPRTGEGWKREPRKRIIGDADTGEIFLGR